MVLEIPAEVEAAAEVEARTRVQDWVTTGVGRHGAVVVALTGTAGLHQHVNVPQYAVFINVWWSMLNRPHHPNINVHHHTTVTMQGDSRILWIQRVILVSDHGPHLMAAGRKISGDHMLML